MTKFPDYPWTGHFHVSPCGARQHYLDEGQQGSIPVLCVHGNPAWSFTWRRLITALAPQRRVIAPDHLGMGLSDHPIPARYTYRLADRIADLESLMAGVYPQGPLDIVCHDWGGAIGLGWARKHAARIRRVVLCNTAAFPLPAGCAFPWQLTVSQTWLGNRLIQYADTMLTYALCHCTVQPLSPAVQAAWRYPHRSSRTRYSVRQFVADIPRERSHPSWETLQAIANDLTWLQDKPVFLPWGLKDFVFNAHFLREWQRRLPHARSLERPDAGHWLLEDAPELVGEIRNFLQADCAP